MVKHVYEDPEHHIAFKNVLDEIEWWCIHRGDDWIENTPNFESILKKITPSAESLKNAVEQIISKERFQYDDNWMFSNVVMLSKTSGKKEIEAAIPAPERI